MKKSLLIIAISLLTHIGIAQTRQTTINYELSRVNGLEQVGGDLIIGNINLCPIKLLNTQILFESSNSTTIFIDVNNRGGGNSCVTLVLETDNGLIRKDIPDNSQTGVLKFTRVKRAFLSIQKTLYDITIDELTSIGTATLWF